jgi:hypothetical protein
VIYALIALHLCAVAFHLIFLRDGVLGLPACAAEPATGATPTPGRRPDQQRQPAYGAMR